MAIDESLLTGESVILAKASGQRDQTTALLAGHRYMAFTGSMVANGHTTEVVISTGAANKGGQH